MTVLRNSLIIAPLKSEFTFLTESFVKLGFKGHDDSIGTIPIKRFPDLNFICAIGGHGKVQFGIQTQFLLNKLPYVQRVFCAGAAGSLAKIKALDVIVAVRTIEHDYTERFDPIAPPFFDGCKATITALKAKLHGCPIPFGVHFDLIASGDEDIVSLARATELHGKTQALAVAWEGAGGARACLFNAKPFLEVRGITDVADTEAPGHFRANLRQAMHNIAVVLA